MKDIFTQLNDFKDELLLGASSGAKKASARAEVMAAIGHKEQQSAAVFAGFFRWSFRAHVSQPMTAAVVLACFLVGGFGTVQVASASLPGDRLYGLKLVTEQAQLRLASIESKAVLHTEFAERRLTEAMTLTGVGGAASAHAATAMDAFKKELALADTTLRELHEGGSEETIKIAQAVDEKIEELSSVLETSNDGASEESTEDGQTAEELARAVSETVTDVIVETVEESGDEVSSYELGAMFKDDLREIQNRQTYDLGRLVVIRNAFEAYPDLRTLESLSSVNEDAIEFSITQATEGVPEAMSLMAVGGYRTAFDLLQEANNALLTLEADLVTIESSITQGIHELFSVEDESEQSSEASSAKE